MCAEKLQRILMAIVLTVSLFLLINGSVIGIILQVFVIVMVLIWALTNFCPSLWAFEKMFGSTKGHAKGLRGKVLFKQKELPRNCCRIKIEPELSEKQHSKR